MQPILLKAHEAAQLLGISERAFHSLRHKEGFPLPITLGERAVRWRTAEIEKWISGIAGESKPEPAQLAGSQKRRVSTKVVTDEVAA